MRSEQEIRQELEYQREVKDKIDEAAKQRQPNNPLIPTHAVIETEHRVKVAVLEWILGERDNLYV